MKWELQRTRRYPHWPWWSMVAVAVWAVMVGLAVIIARVFETSVTLCLLKRSTGIPCPTCGSTRAMLLLGEGRFGQAVATQPFMLVCGGIGVLMLLFRLSFAKRIHLVESPVPRRIMWGLVTALFLVNWVYIIVFVG